VRATQVGKLSARTVYVYPTALKAASVLREQARTDGCLLGHRVTTFPQLTDALARDLGVAQRVLDDELAAVILAHAVERPGIPDALRGPRHGLQRDLVALVGELKAAYLDPPDVAALATAMRAHGVAGRGLAARAADRFADLAAVHAAYEAALARLGAVDRHGRDRLVCEGLAAAEREGRVLPTLAGVERIVFAEIYDFSLLQFLIATTLVRLIGDAELIAFAHPENVDATRFLERTWNRFVGDAGIADRVLPEFVVRGGRQGSLAAALRGVFAADRPAPVPGDGSIRVVVAPSRYREVEAAVRDVRRRLEAGARPERMALLVRDLGLYGDLIEDVCRRFRVPVYFRKGKPLLANPLVKACVNLVRCVDERWPRNRLDALVDTDYLRTGGPGLARTLRESGFVSEAARSLEECLAHRAAGLPDDARAAFTVRGARLVEALRPLRALAGVRSVRGHVAALRRTLGRLGLRPAAADDVAGLTGRRDAQAWTRLDETLTALAGIATGLGVGPVALHEFVGLLLAALEPQQVEDPAEDAGSVRALSVRDARGLDFDVVFLLGLDDGTFPAPRSESPLLPDAFRREAGPLVARLVREKLGPRAEGVPLGGLLRTAREASLEDPFHFFLALSMAEHELVLSYPAADERGNPTVRSPFVDEVGACLVDGLPGETLASAAVVPAVAECCEPAELVLRAAIDRWAPRAGAPADRLSAALRAGLPGGEVRLAAIDRRARIEERRSRYFLLPRGDQERKDALADAFVGRLARDPTPLAARILAEPWSPTRLEALGRCGFKFFASYGLGLREERDPVLEVEAMEQGTLFHRVLEEFLRAHPTLPEDPDAARAVGRRFLAGVRDAVARAIPAKDPVFLDLTWDRLGAALDELVGLEQRAAARRRADGLTVERWLEERIEFSVADGSGRPPIVVAGTPDRVEVERRGADAVTLRVLDYKASRNPYPYRRLVDPKRELGKTGFQIPVYLLGALAAARAGVSEETALEGGYLVLFAAGEGKRATRPLSRALLGLEPGPAEADPSIIARIRDLVAAARAGRFDVNPNPCDEHCAFRAICRYQPPPLEDDADG
jgi:ATP-dependent helicase/nuclease subunit B